MITLAMKKRETSNCYRQNGNKTTIMLQVGEGGGNGNKNLV